MSPLDILIAGRYRVVRLVGTGGMGVVWEAWDERLHRAVALKQLHPQPGLSQAEAELANDRAMREARITARLHHPHAVPVFDVVEHDGHPCLVMQFLPSKPLSAVLQERRQLPPLEAARIGAQVASALAAAHHVGIVHRDVKPGNVLIDDNGTARISDFGISHALGDVTLTSTGMVTGTPAYLAPEVARGGEFGFASDVFSLGATVYTAIEGAPPFGTDQNSIALLHRVASGNFVPPSRSGVVTPELLHMLSSDPADRPSMNEAAHALDRLAAGADVAPRVRTAPAVVESPVVGSPVVGSPVVESPVVEPAVLEPTVASVALGAESPTPTPTPAPVALLPAIAAATVESAVPTQLSSPPGDVTPAVPMLRQPVPHEDVVPEDVVPEPTPERPTQAVPTQEVPTAAAQRTGASAIPAGRPVQPPTASGEARRRLAWVTLAVVLLLGVATAALLGLQRGRDNGGSAARSSAGSSNSTRPASSTTSTPTTASSSSKLSPSKSSSSSSSPASKTSTTSSSSSTHRASTPLVPPPASTSAARLAQAITGYYAVMPGNTDQGWSRLTPSYQSSRAGGRGSYNGFWGSIRRVTSNGATGTPPGTAQATITYYFKDGRVVRERTSYGLVNDGGVLKINSSKVLSSSTR